MSMSRHLYNLERQTSVLRNVGYHIPCMSAGDMSFADLFEEALLSGKLVTEPLLSFVLISTFGEPSLTSSAADDRSLSMSSSPTKTISNDDENYLLGNYQLSGFRQQVLRKIV